MPNDIKGILEVLRNNPREYFIKGMDYVFTNPLNSKLVGQAFKLELELLAKKEHHIFATCTSDVTSVLEIGDFSKVETNLLKQLYDWYQSELSSIDKLNTPRIKRNISKIPSLIANLENKPKTKIYNKPKATISSAELDASKREAELEKLKRINLELKFAALEAKQKEQ